MTSLLYTHADRQGHGVAFRALVIERIVLKFTNLDIRLKTAKLTKITFNSCIRLKKSYIWRTAYVQNLTSVVT